jgi:hypothetical protein
MNDDLAPAWGRLQELLPDPQEVTLALLMKGNMRPDARMYEKIVAEFENDIQALKEGEVGFGHG